MKTNYFIRLPIAAAVLLSTLHPQLSTVSAQGSLTPPGAPGPTMKTLGQIEPRTAIAALPFTITNVGAYYLTTNLTGTSGANGISVSASDVTLDLNGFTLSGVPGSVNGIQATTNAAHVVVRNGAIRNWGGAGVNADQRNGCVFERLRISGNGSWGLLSGLRSMVKDCTAFGNSGGGINADYHSLGSGCVSAENGGDGFWCAGGGTLHDCLAMNNSGTGFVAGDVSVLNGCTSRDNSGKGYDLGAGCAVNTCSATANGEEGLVCNLGCTITDFAAKNNSGTGISAYNHGCVLQQCTARQNGGTGILGSDGTVITDCSSRENADGIQTGVGSTVSQCSAISNGGQGINAGVGSSVKDCTARDNGDIGIAAGTGSTVSGCSVHYNRIGISFPNDCYVLNNTVYGNSQSGILATLDNNRIDGNNVTSTSAGWGIEVGSTNNLVIRNSARSNASGNYTNAPGNTVGEILNFSAGGTITNGNPWANFSF